MLTTKQSQQSVVPCSGLHSDLALFGSVKCNYPETRARSEIMLFNNRVIRNHGMKKSHCLPNFWHR